MPEYIYSDGQHRRTVVHGMTDMPPVYCTVCGALMHRVPQPVSVVWGQPSPGRGGLNPIVKRYNAALPRLKDEFARKKEEHVNRTANESKATD